jgi:hypothetical protein
MNCIRYGTAVPVIATLILLSPVVAFLMVISAEMLIDLLMGVGTAAVCAVAVSLVGWVLFRKFWPHSDRAPQPEPELVADETVIAARSL